MTFREDKATAMAALFLRDAGGELEYLKLLKLIYLAERESLRVLSISITGDTFYSMRQGPVMSATFDLIKGEEKWLDFDHDNWIRTIKPIPPYRVGLIADFDASTVLSPFEIELVHRLWTEFSGVDQWDLVAWIHETFPEWRKTESRIPIDLRDIFLFGLRLDQHEVESRMQLQTEMSRFERLVDEARTVA